MFRPAKDQSRESPGPLFTAIVAAAVAALQIAAIFLGLNITMTTVLSFIIPAVALSAILIALSMAWIFILIGRQHRRPAMLPATIVVLGVTMVELLVIIVICGKAGSSL